jgi:hypothetical protein
LPRRRGRAKSNGEAAALRAVGGRCREAVMSGFEVVAIVIGVFFVVGFAVGVLLVIALPACRRRRRAGR